MIKLWQCKYHGLYHRLFKVEYLQTVEVQTDRMNGSDGVGEGVGEGTTSVIKLWQCK